MFFFSVVLVLGNLALTSCKLTVLMCLPQHAPDFTLLGSDKIAQKNVARAIRALVVSSILD